MGTAIHDGRFERVAKRDHVPLETIWDNTDKKPGEINPWFKQIFYVNSIANYSVAKIKRENGAVSDTKWDLLSNPAKLLDKKLKAIGPDEQKKIVEESLEMVEQHLDRRIQLFFMQLICCYRTPYHFEWIEANDEFGKGSKLKVKNPSKNEQASFDTEAAHSSTLPCLVAYPKEEWDMGDKSGEFVYLKYGHSYLQHNATIEFARFMNRADCLIDGTHANSQLRNEAIKIVNAVAEGKYGPEAGIRKFMVLLDRFVGEAMDTLESKGKATDLRYLVLSKYRERAQDVKIAMDADSGYFDQLIGVNVEHEREEVLRNVVYRKRFKLIQNCEAVESKIARAILTNQNQMTGKNCKSLKSVDDRLRYILLEDTNADFRWRLERLFDTSIDQLRADIEKNENRLRAFEARAGITAFREAHQGEIGILKRDLRAHFRALDNLELNYRSELFKGLRVDLNSWLQKEFVGAFKKKYKFESMSVPMVSRLEQRTREIGETKEYKSPISQRRKDIDIGKAKKIADTFGVDAGLFLPAIFSSTY